jgi:hypothetical protein
MRYKCNRCEQYIKDKFIFGLLHLCLTEEEYQLKLRNKAMIKAQENAIPYLGSLGKDSAE